MSHEAYERADNILSYRFDHFQSKQLEKMGKFLRSILALFSVSSVRSDETFEVTSCNDAEMVNSIL